MPAQPKIYHIVHADRLASIVADGHLWCDAEVIQRDPPGTTIGMSKIKQRRLSRSLTSHPGLHVGQCVPFYFCPRSVMLYMIFMANSTDLGYRGGQEPIVHLEADLRQVVNWADTHDKRWSFTTSNAASAHFDDYADLAQLDKLEWDAIQATDWQGRTHGKQAEFLVERSFPWDLVERIGVLSREISAKTLGVVQESMHRPSVEIKPDWYY